MRPVWSNWRNFCQSVFDSQDDKSRAAQLATVWLDICARKLLTNKVELIERAIFYGNGACARVRTSTNSHIHSKELFKMDLNRGDIRIS